MKEKINLYYSDDKDVEGHWVVRIKSKDIMMSGYWYYESGIRPKEIKKILLFFDFDIIEVVYDHKEIYKLVDESDIEV